MSRFTCAFAIAALCVAVSAQAHEFKLQSLSMKHPWTRATAPTAKTGGVFMTIVNDGTEDDALIGASSPELAGKIELHTHLEESGVMRMRPVPQIDIPAHGKTELKPGSFHVMLIDLKKPLIKGELLPLTLHFKKSGQVKVEVKVEEMGAMPNTMHGKH